MSKDSTITMLRRKHDDWKKKERKVRELQFSRIESLEAKLTAIAKLPDEMREKADTRLPQDVGNELSRWAIRIEAIIKGDGS